MSADGHPAAAPRPRRRTSRRSPTRSRRRGRSAARRERAEWLRRPHGTRPRARRHRPRRGRAGRRARRSPSAERRLARPGRHARAARSPTASRSSPERWPPTPDEAVAAAARARLPGRRQDRGARRAQDRDSAASRSTSPTTTPSARRPSGSAARCSSSRWSASGAELLAGVVQDPVFGPLVAFGPGGVFAELIGEAAFRIAPLTDARRGGARHRRQGRAARRAASAARRPPTRARSPTSCTGSPASARSCPTVAELDLNPVLALPDRCVAVDARVRVRRPEQSPGPRPGSDAGRATREE